MWQWFCTLLNKSKGQRFEQICISKCFFFLSFEANNQTLKVLFYLSNHIKQMKVLRAGTWTWERIHTWCLSTSLSRKQDMGRMSIYRTCKKVPKNVCVWWKYCKVFMFARQSTTLGLCILLSSRYFHLFRRFQHFSSGWFCVGHLKNAHEGLRGVRRSTVRFKS